MLVDVTSYQKEQVRCGIDYGNRDAQPGTRCTTGRSRITAPAGTTVTGVSRDDSSNPLRLTAYPDPTKAVMPFAVTDGR
jgi:hypothetical protein